MKGTTMSATKTASVITTGREDIKRIQRAINKHGPSRGVGRIVVDGERGPETIAAEIRLGYLLGVEPYKGGTAAAARRQQVILAPATRTSAELGRAKARRAAATAGPQAAITWARQQVGTTEATGNNDGPKILAWQRWAAGGGAWLDRAPYCGIGVANACIRVAGVKASSPGRWASVEFIEDDARAARNGFTGWSGSATTAQPGDLVVLFGRGVHVELVVARVPGGLHTIGFNTSPGFSGSQNNGGGVWERKGAYARPDSAVHGIAHVRY